MAILFLRDRLHEFDRSSGKWSPMLIGKTMGLSTIILFYESRCIEQDESMARDMDHLIQGPKTFFKEPTCILGERRGITQPENIFTTWAHPKGTETHPMSLFPGMR